MADISFYHPAPRQDAAWHARAVLFAFCVPALLAVAFLNTVLGILGMLVLACLMWRTGRAMLCQDLAEDRALQLLAHLPMSYRIYNRVPLVDPWRSRGCTEADLLVYGPNGIFLVEVVPDAGHLSGSDMAPPWYEQFPGFRKISRGRFAPNPIRRARRKALLLERQLRHLGYPARVNPVLFFSAVAADISFVGQFSLPVFTGAHLDQWILEQPQEGLCRNFHLVPDRLNEIAAPGVVWPEGARG
jgi:hypothetical protein